MWFKSLTYGCQVDLRSNDLGPEGGKAIAKGIADSSLTKCDLRQNGLGKEGWCAIFDALRDNQQNKIAKWDLAGQDINTEIVKSLTAYMAVSRSLSKVFPPIVLNTPLLCSLLLCEASM